MSLGDIFSDAGDFLFGGTDDTGIKEQNRANNRKQEFIEKQTQLARRDAYQIQPYVDEARNLGYAEAINALTGILPSQAGVIGDGSYAAQQAHVTGLPQQINAIMGLPVDLSGLQPVALNPDISPLTDITLPEYETPNLGGMNPAPGSVTNSELVAQAYQNGLISEDDYRWHLTNFANTPNLGGARSWSNVGNSGDLIASLSGSPLTNNNRAKMEHLYLTMFPGGAA